MKTKRCTKCHRLKPLGEFYKQEACKDGLYYQCKTCVNKYSRTQREKKKPGLKKLLSYAQKHRIVRGLPEKLCTRCLIWKPLDKYGVDLRYKDGKRFHCKGCISEQDKKRQHTLGGYLQQCFCDMQHRCNNSKCKNYKYYGGRGIKNLFKSFDSFYHHITVDLGLTYENIKNKQIHRTNDGNYEVGGIEFLTRKEHAAQHKEMRKKKKKG